MRILRPISMDPHVLARRRAALKTVKVAPAVVRGVATSPWRLSSFAGAATERQELDRGETPFQTGSQLWREYRREDIPPLCGAGFSPGKWNSGIVTQGNNLILLTAHLKAGRAANQQFDDRFSSPSRPQWPRRTRLDKRVVMDRFFQADRWIIASTFLCAAKGCAVAKPLRSHFSASRVVPVGREES